MAKPETFSGTLWAQKIDAARRYQKKWKNKYKCDHLERYYKGDQWKGKKDFFSINYNPYTLNLFYSTIKQKTGSIVLQKPQFRLSPRAANDNFNVDFAMQSANIKQDVLNTIVQNPNLCFVKHCKRAFIDSFFRFGMLEVGYANDWRNPLKDDVYSESYTDPDIEIGSKEDKVVREENVPINERFYIKRIKPQRFLVSVSDAEDLESHDWYGYLEYYYTRTLKNTDGINFPEPADYSPQYSSELSGFIETSDRSVAGIPSELAGYLTGGEITPVWRIWDNVVQKQFLLRDGDFAELWNTEFKRKCMTDIRWDEELEGFYPIPPSFQWLSPQDEINEAREQLRSFRRRFTRKFFYQEGTVDELEVEKFTSGPDGVVIRTKNQQGIQPIPNPEIGSTFQDALVQAKDDFYTISGTDAQAPQNSDRETATGAKLLAARQAVRESAEGLEYSNVQCDVGRKILECAQENLSAGMWVKYTADPGTDGIMQDMQLQPVFKYIESQDINDGYDYDIEMEVINATPQALLQEQQSFVSFLAIVQSYPAIALSGTLIREAARVSGYRNEKVIQQYQQAAALSMAMKAQQAQMAQGPQMSNINPNNASTAQTSQMATPTPQETNNQLENQLQ